MGRARGRLRLYSIGPDAGGERDQREDVLFGKRHTPEDALVDDVGPESESGADDDGEPSADELDIAAAEQAEPPVDDVGRAEALDDPAQRLAEELEALNDRYLRLAAEFDNYRRRTRREQSELSSVVQADFARRLLPTVDDLARVAATPSESTTVEALEQGMDLILRNLLKELSDAGLQRIEALGATFDPELHQALMTEQTDDPTLDDTVSRVFVDGYQFQGRLVRPAQVEVLRFEPADGEEG